jgi:hypothetical protein
MMWRGEVHELGDLTVIVEVEPPRRALGHQGSLAEARIVRRRRLGTGPARLLFELTLWLRKVET